ncbi:MAG: hypothetical protein ABW069_14510 [Duganella sp.]
MKSVYLRSGLALLCGAILSACGGSDGSLQLSGSISGLNADGLELKNTGNGEVLPITQGSTTNPTTSYTAFSFPKLVSVDEYFNVTVTKNPDYAVCTPSANEGKANVYNAYYVVITCVANQRKLGGSVSGLTTDGLVLANGSETVNVPKAATSPTTFVFPRTVGQKSSFGINVLQQPAGQQCTVTKGATGTIGNADMLDAIEVKCV